MNQPPVLLVDDAAAVLATSPDARELVTELLATGRRNGLAVRSAIRRPLQNPTPEAPEGAATQQ